MKVVANKGSVTQATRRTSSEDDGGDDSREEARCDSSGGEWIASTHGLAQYMWECWTHEGAQQREAMPDLEQQEPGQGVGSHLVQPCPLAAADNQGTSATLSSASRKDGSKVNEEAQQLPCRH